MGVPACQTAAINVDVLFSWPDAPIGGIVDVPEARGRLAFFVENVDVPLGKMWRPVSENVGAPFQVSQQMWDSHVSRISRRDSHV